MTETKKNAKQPDYLGHRKRLRARFLSNEGQDMPDYELLELILTTAIPRRDVKPLAKTLIRTFGSFANVINAPQAKLLEIEGIRETTLTIMKAIKAGALRMSWQNLKSSDEPILNNQDALIDYCRAAMCYQDVEEFRIIFLDSKLKVIGEETQQKGTINQVAIHPREVIKAAIDRQAYAIVMVHNHPSGIVLPSAPDVAITKHVEEAAFFVGILLVDHIIVSKNDVFSFRDHGLIIDRNKK